MPVIMKYDPSLGSNAFQWEVLLGKATKNGAVEVCQGTADGGLVCAGLTNTESELGLEGFKSYGNPINGDMLVVKYSAADLAGTTAPAVPTFYRTYPALLSGKGIRELPTGGYIVGAHKTYGDEDIVATVVKLDAAGNQLWSKEFSGHGELTDIAVLTDGSFALSGHRHAGTGIDGAITKVAADGTLEWSINVGNPVGGMHQFAGLGAGNPTLIYGALNASAMFVGRILPMLIIVLSAHQYSLFLFAVRDDHQMSAGVSRRLRTARWSLHAARASKVVTGWSMARHQE